MRSKTSLLLGVLLALALAASVATSINAYSTATITAAPARPAPVVIANSPGAASLAAVIPAAPTPTGPPPPYPSPTPGAPCTLCEAYSGYLSGTGDYDSFPNGTYYYSSVSGYHRGWLRGPGGLVDFDLYLRKWNGFGWVTVAQGVGATADEDVSYYGTAGYYIWRVESYHGRGSFNFWMRRP